MAHMSDICSALPLPAVGVLTFFLLLMASLTDAVAAEGRKSVVLVQVLHRHGARAGIQKHNRTLICTESPCGHLTTNGITMMKRVGAYLRHRYNTDASVVAAPMFPSKDYDLDVVYSRSTDVLRTLQSAEAFLYGFFPNTEALFPAIHTESRERDRLLSLTASIPYLHYYIHHDGSDAVAVSSAQKEAVDTAFPDWTVLQTMGKAIHSHGLCDSRDARASCAFELFDIAAAKKAAGLLHTYPLLERNYDRLYAVALSTFRDRFQYDTSKDLDRKQGGRGRVFVQQMLSNMDDTVAGLNTFKLMHYSGHDSTLAPVWATLGDRSDNGMLPPFAQTLVAELLEDGAGAHHVRVLRGHPGQDPVVGFEFAWDATWQLRCVDARGALYTAADNTCPLADFRRLVAWSAPTAASGLCYLDDAFAKIRNCPEDGGPAALSATCVYYRERCADFSCAVGCVLNGVTLQCVCPAEHTGAIAVASFCVGGVCASTAIILLMTLRFIRHPLQKLKG